MLLLPSRTVNVEYNWVNFLHFFFFPPYRCNFSHVNLSSEDPCIDFQWFYCRYLRWNAENSFIFTLTHIKHVTEKSFIAVLRQFPCDFDTYASLQFSNFPKWNLVVTTPSRKLLLRVIMASWKRISFNPLNTFKSLSLTHKKNIYTSHIQGGNSPTQTGWRDHQEPIIIAFNINYTGEHNKYSFDPEEYLLWHQIL